MTNTIPNVPRELLADLLCDDHDRRIMAERHLLAMLANAPSPAGVDGLEVIGWYTDDHLNDKSATTYSKEVAERWLAKGWPVTGIANADDAQAIIDGLRARCFSLVMNCAAELETASYCMADSDAKRIAQSGADYYRKKTAGMGDAQAIIDGLRGELQQSYQQINSECMDWAKEYERRKAVQAERDTLKSMLREFAVGISKREMPTEQELNSWFDRIDAALSAGKEDTQ